MASSTPDAFEERLASIARAVDDRLASLLADRPEDGEIVRPERLMAAMRHAVLAGGKRFRPFLLVETAALFGVPREEALSAAAALECLHT